MDYSFVFTLASLQRYLETAADQDWPDPSRVPSDGSWEILALSTEHAVFVIHRDDTIDCRRIVVMAQDDPGLSAKAALQRIHRIALADKLPIRLPPSWAEFHFENFIAFFAWPPGAGRHAVRWIAEIGPDNTKDVCFWRLTGPDDPIQLQRYSPPYAEYRDLVREWGQRYAQAMVRFPVITEAQPRAIQAAVDLDVSTFGAVTQARSYSTWLPHLTERQREFVDWPTDTAVKLRGPAGSGKTLALELKLLHELYRARDDDRSIRILFATHSWAVAEQVDAALQRLDEGGDLSSIDVFPLLEIARLQQPAERQGVGSYRLLGEDSLSGRREQLTRISEELARATKGDWLVFRRQTTPEFQARVGSALGSPEWNNLVWDLMLEFSGVLAAHGILPGINAERRYLALERTQWMMPLQTEAEKRFVVSIYTRYVASLTEQGLLTSDQLINDYLNYLETFVSPRPAPSSHALANRPQSSAGGHGDGRRDRAIPAGGGARESGTPRGAAALFQTASATGG